MGKEPILAPMVQVNEEFMKAQETNPEENAPYLFAYLLLYCFTIVQATMWIQLSHVSMQRYHPFGKLFTFNLIALAVQVIVLMSMETVEIDTRMDALILLGITVFFQWLFIFRVIYEITNYLKIKVFRTKQSVERENAKKNGQGSSLGSKDDD